MTKFDEIKAAIADLPREEFTRLRRWIAERDWQEWDAEVKADSESGKLDFLIEEARHGKRAGRLGDL